MGISSEHHGRLLDPSIGTAVPALSHRRGRNIGESALVAALAEVARIVPNILARDKCNKHIHTLTHMCVYIYIQREMINDDNHIRFESK